jgi:segregation and condensation protein A
MKSGFEIKLEHFEGPLELLLSLIEKHKLSINQISLSKVADDFISYIKSLEDFPISESADFILTASTLILIKSKSLLPSLELSKEEEGNIEDLERRLRLYQKIKDLSINLKKSFGKNQIFFANDRPTTPVFSPHEAINTIKLYESAKNIISVLPKFEKLPKAVVQKVMSLEEMIGNLSKRIEQSLKLSFKDFSGMGKKEKVHVIVSLLAMLELVKQGAIKVAQDDSFSDITIETEKDLSTPQYV